MACTYHGNVAYAVHHSQFTSSSRSSSPIYTWYVTSGNHHHDAIHNLIFFFFYIIFSILFQTFSAYLCACMCICYCYLSNLHYIPTLQCVITYSVSILSCCKYIYYTTKVDKYYIGPFQCPLYSIRQTNVIIYLTLTACERIKYENQGTMNDIIHASLVECTFFVEN